MDYMFHRESRASEKKWFWNTQRHHRRYNAVEAMQIEPTTGKKLKKKVK